MESTDADTAFRVGLIHGPSGCGKTSLVRAGLLPRLAQHVTPIYLEALRDGTEARLQSKFAAAWDRFLTCLRNNKLSPPRSPRSGAGKDWRTAANPHSRGPVGTMVARRGGEPSLWRQDCNLAPQPMTW